MGSASSTPDELLARWEELKKDESVMFPLQLLAEEFDYVGRVATLQTRLIRLGVDMPKLNQLAYERDHAISEIKFLRTAGQGVTAIAEALGWTVDQLVSRTHYWHHEGLIDFDLDNPVWRMDQEQWKSAEFALGPKARNGKAGSRAFRDNAGGDMAMRGRHSLFDT